MSSENEADNELARSQSTMAAQCAIVNSPVIGFWREKALRAAAYFSYRFGWRQKECTACRGSGRYDNHGAPRCGGCDGTGKEWQRGPKWSENAFVQHSPRLAVLYFRVIEEQQRKLK